MYVLSTHSVNHSHSFCIFSYSPGTQELGGVNLKVKLLRGVTPPPESDTETSSSVGSAACTTDIVHMKVSVYSPTNVLCVIYISLHFRGSQIWPWLRKRWQEEQD